MSTMSAKKISTKPKFTEDFEDFIEETTFLIESPKTKKGTKRSKAMTNNIDEDVTIIPQTGRKIIGAPSAKKPKENGRAFQQVTEKLKMTMEDQIKTRKQGSDAFLKELSTVMEEMKEDCLMLKSNQEKLHKLTASFMKCFTQVTEANEQKLTSLNDIYTAFKKQSDDADSNHRDQASKLANELEQDIEKLHQKLIAETKRKSLEQMQNYFKSMHADYNFN